MAEEADLDLVVISPNQAPPVAKILNFGKYKYELEKKAKEAKKKQKIVEIKEIKVRYKIDTHDYEVRLKNIKKFISQGNKVKIVVMLRGREMQHSHLAFELAEKFITDLEQEPITVEKKDIIKYIDIKVIIIDNDVMVLTKLTHIDDIVYDLLLVIIIFFRDQNLLCSVCDTTPESDITCVTSHNLDY